MPETVKFPSICTPLLNVDNPVNVGVVNIVALDSFVTLPKPMFVLATAVSDKSDKLLEAIKAPDNDAKAVAGNSFYLTFFVNVNEEAQIQSYSGTVKVDYSRLRESGERQDFFDFGF